ncbi:hypothetical protein [Candidatus Marithrix sp. Canyon 246]|uniref:hypothetical protein n=1 Tax=Candidatus Marithrix sp. Canyon 246 TaxID=1827136 RepID=UPI001C0DC5B8|nr:hypothetical protein [Candidatus Marithrix sp. Canyon 246]
MNLKKQRIEKILKECDKHILRISEAVSDIDKFMPLNTSKYQNLTKYQVQALDQFLFRFSKLQDSIGEKLFKALLIVLDEEVENKPFIDILNRLEKLEILESVEVWRDLRDIRNELAHNYDDSPEEMAIAINNIYYKKDTLLAIYTAIVNSYDSYINQNNV